MERMMKMTNRVNNLIEYFLFTKNPLSYACRHLGFDESDSSEQELETLGESIFPV